MDKCLILSRFSRSERPSRHLPLGLFRDLDSITGSPPREKTRSLVIPKGENSITGSPQGRRLDHWFSLKRLDWITGSPPRRITGCLPREETGSPGFPPPQTKKKEEIREFWLSYENSGCLIAYTTYFTSCVHGVLEVLPWNRTSAADTQFLTTLLIAVDSFPCNRIGSTELLRTIFSITINKKIYCIHYPFITGKLFLLGQFYI